MQLELVGRCAARRRGCSRSATSTSRSIAFAAPTSRSSAASAQGRGRAGHRGPAAPRQLPLPPRRPRGRRTRVGRTLLPGFASWPSAGPARWRRAGVELLLTLDEGNAQGRPQVEHRGHRPGAAALVHPARRGRRGALPRRAAARARRRRRGEARARSSSCCAPSPTSTPTRRRCGASASSPTWWAAAATGRSSRSRTCCACSPASRTRSTTRCCSAPSPVRVGVSPDALWLLRAATGPERAHLAVIAHVYGEAERAPDDSLDETGSADSADRTPSACAPSASASPPCERAPR